MKGVIIGAGEIGTALDNILKQYYETFLTNERDFKMEGIEILHICFPYSDEFVSEVKRYQELYKPKYTVIHSTVPVGTSKGLNAIHSPVIGLHPFLEESIKTFTKYLGGKEAGDVADYFRKANIKVYITDKSETTELMKLLSTTKFGLDIEYTKEVKRLCDRYKVPYEAWTLWNDTYNKGYEKLGYPEYKRPQLIPIMKKIDGHCIIPNLDLLKSRFTTIIKKLIQG